MWSFVWLELNVELCRVLPPILEVVLIIVLADQRQSLHSIGTPKNLVTYILTIDSISLGHIRNNCIPSLGASQFNSALEMYFLFLLTLMFSALKIEYLAEDVFVLFFILRKNLSCSIWRLFSITKKKHVLWYSKKILYSPRD